MPPIKPTFGVNPRSSFSVSRKRGSGLMNLRDSMYASLPNLNAPQEAPIPKLESTSNSTETVKQPPAIVRGVSDDRLTIKVRGSSNEGLTMNVTPVMKRRSGSMELNRSQKALSDVPSEFDSLPNLPPSSATRLLLQADGKEEKNSRFKRSSKRSSIKSSSIFKFNSSRRSIERSRRQQSKKSLSNYPEIKQSFAVTPIGYSSTAKPRTSQLSTSLFSSKSKQSPLRKLSSMSFSTLRSPPKRSGSYKFKPTVGSPRRSLRRSRSLKTRDKPSISLVSMKVSPESKPKAMKRQMTRAPSLFASTFYLARIFFFHNHFPSCCRPHITSFACRCLPHNQLRRFVYVMICLL